ncbi:hypothetical protein DPMN_103457 [Dreissena polymorpha]|uniref:Ion transport domain-containing protein n=1 Tax=Dreissena polymorpha TaxID=45954 RepID=A0A9D4HB25_DREPO|nr:hypothetical protein DPMN_103457 [Dreissena polymorpha]
MDFAILAVYVCSFTLKYVAMVKVHIAIRYLATAEMANIAAQDMNYTQYSLYWIVADRFYWLTWDPINLSEGLFAVANVLTFSRISYFLPVNAALGPLQISVGRMIRDIIKCLCLITMVLVAFVIGLQNVYSYYHVRRTIELIDHKIKPEAEEAFGDIVSTFRTVFWSVFGRGGTDVVLLDQYNNYVTENFGNFLYGLYNVIMVTVLINMLIAMMARSFQAIAEEADIEWKFARSVLYLEYMSNGQVLPVPLNLARIPRGLLEWFCIRCDVTEENLEPPVDHDIYGNDVTNVTHGLNNDEASPALPKALRKEPSAAASPASKRQRISSAASGMSAFGKKLHRRSTVRKTSLPGSVSGVNQYQKVMQRIVQRYIFDIQREEEITEDDFNGIKQDLSGLRHEMLSILNRQSLVDVFDTAFSTRRPSKDYLEDISKRRRSAMSKLRNLRLASRFSGSTDSKRAEQGEVDENLVVQENDEDLIPEDQLADEGDTEHNGGAEDDLEEADTEHNGGAEDDLEEADTEHNGGAEDDLEEADTESQTANYGHINRQGLTDEADDNNDPNVEDEYVDDGYQENQDNDFDATSAGDLYGQVNDALSKVKIYE